MSYSLAMEDIRAYLEGQIDRTIDFRKRKSEQYPEDSRNRRAVEALQKLRDQLTTTPELPIEADLKRLFEDWNALWFKKWADENPEEDPLRESLDSFWREIGFYSVPKDVEKICGNLCDLVKFELEIHGDAEKQ